MSVLAYEERLAGNGRDALREGSMHFERESAVFKSLERIAAKLATLGVPYAVVGGMALFLHGYRRFTEDVDVLVSREGLKRLHDELEGRGWIPPFAGSKNLRDTETGVRIEFLVAGDYPGDGKPKPVAFPEPGAVAERIDGIACLPLATLVELKLASGTSPGRLRDLADVQELIRHLHLPRDFSDRLNPSVRDRYCELWDGLQNAETE